MDYPQWQYLKEFVGLQKYWYFAFHVALSSGMVVLGKTQNSCNQPSILDSFFAPLWKSKIFVFAQLPSMRENVLMELDRYDGS
jgi:hypothetical protein